MRAILKAPGTVKVKLWCFKGIVNPTDIHGSWEPDYSSSHFSKFLAPSGALVVIMVYYICVTFNEGEIFLFGTDLFWRNSLLEVVLG